MKYRILGKITNHDAAAHTPIVVVKGYNRSELTPSNLPVLIHFNALRKSLATPDTAQGDRFQPMLDSGKSVSVDEVVEMDAIESVEIYIHSSYGMICNYEVQVVEE